MKYEIGFDMEKISGAMSVAVGETSLLLEDMRLRLADTMSVRDNAPLAVQQLVRILLEDDAESRRLSSEVLEYLPVCSRPNELHMMLLDSWTWLWRADALEYALDSEGVCRLSNARSLVAFVIVDVLLRTKKGPLFKYQGNHMLTFAGQLLSKFWLPEARQCVRVINSSSDKWLVSLTRMIDFFLCSEEGGLDATRTTVNIEVGLRLVSAAVAKLSLQESVDNSVLMSIFSVFKNSPDCDKYLEAKYSMLDSFVVAPCLSERPADLELCDSDIALLVCYAEIKCVWNPSFLPLIWSEKTRTEILIGNVILLLLSYDHIGIGMDAGVCVLSGPEIANTLQLLTESVVEKFFRILTEKATGWGSEEDYSLLRRQTLFKLISACMHSMAKEKVFSVCEAIVTHSQSDGCIGLILKVAKDKAGNDEEVFFRFARLILNESEYQILDGMDTLKSLLNWARLVCGPGRQLEETNIKWLARRMDSLAKQVDLALVAESDSKSGVQYTRLLFIGHLLGAVRDLMGGGKVR